ncbi:MAG: glycosyltransferase [Cyanobacteria bacterium J06639_16]
MNTMRLMVYSHDAFGLGNLRRMLAISEYLLSCWPRLSILLVSGSPMLQGFRLPKGLDYIKLPCLSRGISGELSAKYLGTSIEETVELRSQLICSAATYFKPDLLLVDKKPAGLKGELTPTLNYLQQWLPKTKRILLLRDILDAPQKTIYEWKKLGYYQAIQAHYDQIQIVGMQTVFDLVQEYRLPLPIAHKVRYCGYVRKQPGNRSRADLRQQLGVGEADRLVLVTPGGGEDGYDLVHTYLQGLKSLQAQPGIGETVHSLILCGPEMPGEQQMRLQRLAATCTKITLQNFTDDLLSYLAAADAVVSMGGYNTLTEILTLGKRTVVVPRVTPSQEQLIRATRFTERGLVDMIHPANVTPRSLIQAVIKQLTSKSELQAGLDFNGLPQVANHLAALLSPAQPSIPPLYQLA